MEVTEFLRLRASIFKQSISDTLAAGDLVFMHGLLEQYRQEHDVPAMDIAAALAQMTIGKQPLLLEPDKPGPPRKTRGESRHEHKPRSKHQEKRGDPRKHTSRSELDKGMERFRIEVGRQHNVKPGNIVGAIANEAGLDAKFIGHIDIQGNFSLVDLPRDMPQDVFLDLKKMRVCGQRLNISRLEKEGMKPPRSKGGKHKGKNRK